MQRVKWLIRVRQAIISMFLASVAALMISTAPAYAAETTDAATTNDNPAAESTTTETTVAETPAAVAEAAPAAIAAEATSQAAQAQENMAPAADSQANTEEASEPATTQSVGQEAVAESLVQVADDGAQVELVADDANTYTISESGSYVLSGEGDTSVSIIGRIQVALRLVNASINAGADRSAISIEEGAEVSIVVEGDCQLQGKNGISVPAGTTNVDRWLSDSEYSDDGKTLKSIPYSETAKYVKKVTDAWEKYRNIYGE